MTITPNIIEIEITPIVNEIEIAPNTIVSIEQNAEWGEITGDITNQTDLQLALNALQSAIENISLAWGNISGLIDDQVDLKALLDAKAAILDLANVAFSGDYGDITNKPTIINDHTQLNNIGTNSHEQIDLDLLRLANTSGINTGDQDLSGKQNVLVSGTNIKTINNNSILGSGNLAVTFDQTQTIIINKTAENNTREILLKGTVSDGGNAQFLIANGSGVNGNFVPSFAAYQENGTVSTLGFSGFIPASANSNPIVPVLAFTARIANNSTSPLNGNWSLLTVSPVLGVSNNLTLLMLVSPIGNVKIQNGITTVATAQLDIINSLASQPVLKLKSAVSQSANIFEIRDSANTLLTNFSSNGAFQPVILTDENAPNSSLYYSSTQSRFVYKDSTGNYNNLIQTGNITTQITAINDVIEYNGNSNINLSDDPQIVVGTNGRRIIIINSSTNTLTINNGNGLRLNNGLSFTFNQGDTMQLVYSTSLSAWLEVSRSENS